ncbi:MAG: NADP-dependent alcohol dehydrogenase 2 [Ferruginibacter sp.]|uniref:NAD(P)-dependent alcohol dehydrogenase n=1 Tax=Ferruginibacter sp. TaxID=1940288 RepID=UPI0026590C32|nr:NAD(P)-dependent alcohol dehydrogenase [Ferruginibacter sp.]MDB5278537.1 NADP-dependent alcohol dehydrogenase 2 [Ferruginibacter sp.]
MISTKAYAAQAAAATLTPYNFERREPGPHDVLIDILFCGVCHTDIHFINNDWGFSIYPMVPGHEIVGRVTAVGDHVKKFKAGDMAGVGCLVDSCRECDYCNEGLEQYCQGGNVFTYSGLEKDGKTVTQGGYSNKIVVDERFVLKVSEKLSPAHAAPLLCAGITTYSPLRHWKVGKGHKIGIIGLGGLGHMAIKFAASFGAEVTVLSTSPNKKEDALKLGAHNFVVTKDEEQVKAVANTFDFILDTLSASHDYNMYVGMLKVDGTLICVGLPPEPINTPAFNLVFARKCIAGSLIGGLPETQEMLDYCAAHNIVSDVEIIPIQKIQEAYERMLKSDIKYRFVIDMASLG